MLFRRNRGLLYTRRLRSSLTSGDYNGFENVRESVLLLTVFVVTFSRSL